MTFCACECLCAAYPLESGEVTPGSVESPLVIVGVTSPILVAMVHNPILSQIRTTI